MSLLFLLARDSWRVLLTATLTGLICGLAAAGLIALINEGLEDFNGITYKHGLLFLGLTAVVVVSRTIADVSMMHLGQVAVSDLRMHLSGKLVDTSFARLQSLGKHRLLAMLTDDAQTISNAVELVPILIVNLGIVAACMIYLGWLSPPLLALTVVFFALLVVSLQFPQRKAQEAISKSRDVKDQLFEQYRLLSDGTKELQLNQPRRQQFFNKLLLPTSLKYKDDFVRGMSIYAVALNWGNGIFYLLMGAVLYAAPLVVEVKTSLITGYILAILYMITPLSELINVIPALGRASVSLQKVRSLEGLLDAGNVTDRDRLPVPVNKLECKSVSHTYFREQEDGKFTLGPFDLSLQSGELIFITGGNGSGKTTLALLLTGLYQPETGDITLNNAISSTKQSHYFRQHFSAIFTDFCLFEHLLDGENPQLIQKAQEYLIHLQLDHKVSIENGKLSTLDLSTGQRKRLALLMAYLDDRPCYLFDEWAADQDPIFKRFFYTEILPDLKQRGKLVIVITHDDGYFYLADKLVKVDQGHVMYSRPPQIEHPEKRAVLV